MKERPAGLTRPRGAWHSFATSYDATEAATMSSPLFIVAAASTLIGVILCVAYLPGLAEEAKLRGPWVSIVQIVGAAILAIVASRHGARGTVGTLATLLDNGLHVGSLAWAAANSSRTFGFFFSALLAGMLVAFQGSAYGFSLLMAAVVLGPPLVIVVLVGPDPAVSLALASACILGLLRMETTRAIRQRRQTPEEVGVTLTGESGARYQLRMPIGSGGMATVFRASTDGGRKVAVKCLHPHWFDSPDQQKRLFREARIVNSLSHPGVVPIIDHGTVAGKAPFLVMELLEGRTLREALEEAEHPLSSGEALRIAEQVLDVLDAAHAQGIVHCDVKPSNIFLLHDGQVRLLDFGIARPPVGLLNTTLSVHVAGTPACMAPEQVLHPEAVDGRADLWAVGATIFRAVTGKWPRELPEPCASLLEAASAPIRRVESLAPTLPAEVVQVVNRALALDPESRWPSARAMRDGLRSSVPKVHAPIERDFSYELR